ncbi:MAG TPA: DNA adenine methylase [Nitrososphaera sp.]|nr:DNA adenine methylase [Nitrososphaera sp.]
MPQRQILTRPMAAPFVKWAGGKTQLLATLDSRVPPFTRYFEPFLGGGAFFFHLASRLDFTAYLSDANSELVNAYNVVKNNVEELIRALEAHEKRYRKNPKRYYYKLRSQQPADMIEAAARFITLNKTCYNGLYRVNRSGRFNVPMGRYSNPTICDRDQLRKASAALNYSDAKIIAADYRQVLEKARAGDFVYLDPPFIPLSRTANFVEYTKDGFGKKDQVELAAVFRDLDRKGCKILLSNSDTELVRELYSGFVQTRAGVMRAISCKGSMRTGYSELLISNYGLA